MIQNVNPNTKPKNECNSHEMSHEMYLHAHQPNYYENLHVTLYFVKYNNSIPFCKEKSCQVNRVLIDC